MSKKTERKRTFFSSLLRFAEDNQYAGGVLYDSAVPAAFEIAEHTKDGRVTVVLQGPRLPSGPLRRVAALRPLPVDDPKVRAPSEDETALYDLMQPTTQLAANRFADAYLEPTYSKLAHFASTVFGNDTEHIDGPVGDFRTVYNPFRGTYRQGTDLFWIVYASTAFEPTIELDLDPDNSPLSVHGQTDINAGISLLYTETVRDSWALDGRGFNGGRGLTLPQFRARVMVHEVGHQFFTDDMPDDGHRNDGANIMHAGAGTVPEEFFRFHAADIVKLRSRVESPRTSED